MESHTDRAAKESPRPATECRIELLSQPPSPEGYFALRISLVTATRRHTRTLSALYRAREIPADGMGNGCRGFEVQKVDAYQNPIGERYHILLDARDGYRRCDCQGGERGGRCKHADALAALHQAGRLPHPSAADFARNDPIAFDRHLASLIGFGGEPADEIDPSCHAGEDAWQGREP